MILKRTSVALAVACALLTTVAGAAVVSHIQPVALSYQKVAVASAPSKLVAADGTANIIIILKNEPLAPIYARQLQASGGGTMGKTSAAAKAQSALSGLQAAQNTFVSQLKATGVQYREIYRVHAALNGIAVRMKPQDMAKVRALPNVASVSMLPVYKRPSNIVSVPFVNAPEVWAATTSLGLPFNATGAGVKMGDIDTGLDYVHPDFGGTGLLADYQNIIVTSNTGVDGNPVFPTAKVVGGTDFVGDAYDASNDPVPDPNPMDCDDHGSHTAGTMAGLGVNSDGTPYTGLYNPVAPYAASLKIGPGMAPGADLYALRVFGCGGSTAVVDEAIDWAIDPTGTGDLSQRLDVINMSLGSPDGIDSASYDSDIQAVNNAVLTGMIVVSAAGNDGDTFFINGAPAAANVGISAAASIDPSNPGVVLTQTAPTGEQFVAEPSAYANPTGDAAPPTPGGQSAGVVLALDSTGGTSLGCGTFSNGAALVGKFALIDRGSCNFTVKALAAQGAGAVGWILADSATSTALPFPIDMGGTATAQITIPGVSITHANGAILKSELGTGAVATTFTAASAADTLASFSSRGPTTGDGGVVELKPDIAAPGLNIPSVQSGITCNGTTTTGCIVSSPTGFLAGGQVLTISGTSMATPHIAGLMALLRQLNPSMSVEQLKALAMNGAAHDLSFGDNGILPLFGASRVGAGRIDAANAAASKVIAYNGDVTGAVSVTFDVEPVGPSFTATHNVTLVNRTAVIQSVTLELDTILDSPGLSFSVPSRAINIPAGGSTSFQVTLNADTSLMKRYIDPSMATEQASTAFGITFPRQFTAEESALIKVLDAGSNELARLPVYAANRPHSTMTTAGDLGSAAPLTGTTNLTLSGQDVCTGTLAAGPTCNDSPSIDEESLVSAFELQFTGAQDPTLPVWANLHYVGVNSQPDANGTNADYFFGVSTYAKWGSPVYASYNVCVDTDGDGLFDKIIFNSDLGSMDAAVFGVPGAVPEDTYVSAIYDNVAGLVNLEAALNLADASQLDTGTLTNNTMILAAFGPDLSLAAGVTKIHYGIAVCPGFNPLCGAADWTPGGQGTANCGGAGASFASFNGPMTYDAATPGVDGTGTQLLLEDLNGGTLGIPYNVNNLVANGSSGMLLLHTHNTQATSAQVVILDRIFANGFESN